MIEPVPQILQEKVVTAAGDITERIKKDLKQNLHAKENIPEEAFNDHTLDDTINSHRRKINGKQIERRTKATTLMESASLTSDELLKNVE